MIVSFEVRYVVKNVFDLPDGAIMYMCIIGKWICYQQIFKGSLHNFSGKSIEWSSSDRCISDMSCWWLLMDGRN